MKKRIILLLSAVLIVVAFICVFQYYHPTHFAYNDRFIIGNTKAAIEEKYGVFHSIHENDNGELICGIYMVRDNTPELIMGYDNSLWYEIYFQNEIAVDVQLRKGYIGG